MPKPRAILNRVHSVQNVAKITSTMEKIATAKFKKAFDRAVAARPYTDRLGRIIGELAAAAGDFRHPLLEAREEKRVAVLAIAANRGLCGGYNTNVYRELNRLHTEMEARGLPYELHVAGRKLGDAFRFHGIEMAGYHDHFDDKPSYAEVETVVDPFLRRYQDGDLDALYVVYTKFLSSARQKPVVEKVLPLEALGGTDGDGTHGGPSGAGTNGAGPAAGGDYIFSPDPESILSDLLPRSVRLHVFQAFLDAAVSEQTARRVAMKLATDNAGDVIRDLTQLYNRSRQALITTEISEIMGGAAALE